MSIPQPSYLFVTPFIQGIMQQEALRQMVHTYTRQQRNAIMTPPTADNDWGQPQYVYPPPADNQPCYYVQRSRAIVQPYGLMSKNVPTLFIPQGDPLDRGDYVSNIRAAPNPITGESLLLLDGPVEVEDTTPLASNVDGAILVQCSLRDVQIVPQGNPMP